MAYTRLYDIANKYFDKGWSHAVTNQTLDLIEPNRVDQYQFDVACSTTVRIQLPNGTFHEDTGYACETGVKSSTIILAKKRSAFKAMRNTMKWFSSDIANELRWICF